MTEATLEEANLEQIGQQPTQLIRTNIQGANLSKANLAYANFREAVINEANFQEAILEWANLTLSQVVSTDFTNAHMTGACIEAWNIESSTKLEDVDCDFVYLLENPKPKTDDRERRPSSGKFAPGEFTKLFQEVLIPLTLFFVTAWIGQPFSLPSKNCKSKIKALNLQSRVSKTKVMVLSLLKLMYLLMQTKKRFIANSHKTTNLP
ncbi:MAG: hypothetical protein BRC52_05265 [Cyanobacteria bacterium SW_5_48_44]|nr:MAG: hypothetical protein BRC52_05265 [Cyanobacteria bacterium SW_5_48_44]